MAAMQTLETVYSHIKLAAGKCLLSVYVKKCLIFIPHSLLREEKPAAPIRGCPKGRWCNRSMGPLQGLPAFLYLTSLLEILTAIYLPRPAYSQSGYRTPLLVR